MEISAIIQGVGETEVVLETSEKETLRLPKRLLPGKSVGQTVYVACSEEPSKPAREIVNELLGSDDSP